MQSQNNESLKDKDLSELFDALKAELLDYSNKKFQYFKLEAYEKISIIFSLIAFCVIVMVMAAGLLFFGLFGAAFFIGELLNSLAAGFGILFAFILIILVFVLLFRRSIRSFIMNKAILIIRKIEENEEF